ncbi:hypothetical protein WG70_23440 [Burkholderia oklahomensis EO147]|nr:hypothetical protein WG70_23440 [Burkholderia oklahomensis EO147]
MLATAYAFAAPVSARTGFWRADTATAVARFDKSVAVVPSSVAFWPVWFTTNCATTAAMMLDWRQTLLSCADCAVPD